MMVAADTFRAGAIDQLVEWGKRSQTFVYTKEAGSDPSSVIYDALEIARKEKYDVVAQLMANCPLRTAEDIKKLLAE